MRRVIAVLASCLMLSACGGATRPEPRTAPPTEPRTGPRTETAPRTDATSLPAEQEALEALEAHLGSGSAFHWGDKIFHFLAEDGSTVDRAPWTACLGNGCWDGAPTLGGPVHTVGSPDALYFAFDYPGWSFDDVSFNPVDERCRQRVIRVRATQVSDRVFRIDPTGESGPWRVDVFGRGPAGDAVTSILWDTPTDGTKGARAAGVAAVLAEHDGVLDSYGVELSLSRLDRSYPDATAQVRVTGRSGRSVTITPRLGRGTCGYVGDLFFTAPDDQGRRATGLGDGPFRYTAKVRLGDTTYVGTGTYPDDLVKGNEPNIRLTWEPPLPSYAE